MACCQHKHLKHITTVLCHGNVLDEQMSQFYEMTLASLVAMIVPLLDIKFPVRARELFKHGAYYLAYTVTNCYSIRISELPYIG